MKYKLTIFLLIFFLIVSCSNGEETYVMQAIDLIEKNALNADRIDWSAIKNEASEKLKKENTREVSHEILQHIITLLDDNHSAFVVPAARKKMYAKEKIAPTIKSKRYHDTIGYVNIPSFTGNDSLVNTFATQIQANIKKLDQQHVKNWIVDLRDNSGGNMWPMLLGLSPLLDEGTLGYFVSNTNEFLPWKSKNGAVFSGENMVLNLKKPYSLKSKKHKIAILIDHYTCSAGEAVAIAFSNAENTKLIGSKTCGRTTGNMPFTLSDGAMLIVTTTTFANRDKQVFGEKVIPALNSSQPLIDAIQWIQEESQ